LAGESGASLAAAAALGSVCSWHQLAAYVASAAAYQPGGVSGVMRHRRRLSAARYQPSAGVSWQSAAAYQRQQAHLRRLAYHQGAISWRLYRLGSIFISWRSVMAANGGVSILRCWQRQLSLAAIFSGIWHQYLVMAAASA